MTHSVASESHQLQGVREDKSDGRVTLHEAVHVLEVCLDDAVHLGEVDHDSFLESGDVSLEGGAGAVGNHRDVMSMTEFRYLSDFFSRLRETNTIRQPYSFAPRVVRLINGVGVSDGFVFRVPVP